MDCVYHDWDAGLDRVLIQLPTGTGKTICMGAIAERFLRTRRRPVLLLAHRTELIDQAVDKLARMGIDTVIEQGLHSGQRSLGRLNGSQDVVVCGSVATMQKQRLALWPRRFFGAIMVDEVHHVVADTYRKILNHFQDYKLLGVTATSDRADGQNLGQIFNFRNKPAYLLTLHDAIYICNPPLLAEIVVRSIETGIDLSDLKAATADTDLNMKDVEEKILPHIQRLTNIIAQEIGTRKAILFAPNVRSAEAFASALSSPQIGIKAASVSVHDGAAHRQDAVQSFRQGVIQVLCNYGIFTEGFDEASIEAVIIARPTTSRSLYEQMTGRGTRLYPGKEYCLLVDLAMLSEKHDLVHPCDLFDNSELEPDIVDIARFILKEKGVAMSLQEAIDAADEYKTHYRKLMLTVRAQNATYEAKTLDPVLLCDAGLVPYYQSDWTDDSRYQATAKQVKILSQFGVDAEGLSKGGAGRRITVLLERARKKLSTPKQLLRLQRDGVPRATALQLTIQKASQLIETLK